jgi:hypothetical protein
MRVLIRGGDEGTLLYGAVRVVEGQVPFRDFFEVMGPGTFYWLALFFKIFGTNWFAARIAVMLTALVTTLLIYFLTRRLRSGLDALPAVFLIAVSFPYWLMANHHETSNLFALLSFTVLVLWLERHKASLLYLVGILAGITSCFIQQKGFLLLLSYVLLLWIFCRKESTLLSSVGRLLAGYLTVGASALLLFWSARGLSALLYANLLWPLANYSNVNVVPYGFGLREWHWNPWTESLSAALSPLVGVSAASILVIPFLVLLALPVLLAVFALRYRSLAFTRDTLPYWITGCTLLVSEIHRKDISHLAYGSPILVILCFHLYRQVRHRFNVLALQSVAVCALTLAVFNGLLVLTASTKTVTARGTAHTFGDDAVLDILRSHVKPGEELFAYPYCPMYYFLSATRNPTRYSILMYQMNTRAQFQEVVQSLEQRKVRYVLWDTGFQGEKVKTWFPSYRIPRQDELVVEPYLADHYEVVARENAFCLLERKDTKMAWAAAPRPTAP